jgi:hypothetical protein
MDGGLWRALRGRGDFFSDEVADNFTGGFAAGIGPGAKVCGGNIVYDNDMVFNIIIDNILDSPFNVRLRYTVFKG